MLTEFSVATSSASFNPAPTLTSESAPGWAAPSPFRSWSSWAGAGDVVRSTPRQAARARVLMRSDEDADTTWPMAAPMMTAAARASALVLRRNRTNSSSMCPPPGLRSLAPEPRLALRQHGLPALVGIGALSGPAGQVVEVLMLDALSQRGRAENRRLHPGQ